MSVDVGPHDSLVQKLAGRLFSGPAGAVFRGMATITSGNVVARLIGVAAIPFLTRLYDPASFGVLAIFNAIVVFLVPIVTLRYAVAVPLPKHDGMAMNVVTLAALVALGMSIATTFALWLGGPFVFAALNMSEITPYWWLIVIGVAGGASFELLSMWATRKRDYGSIAQTAVIQSVSGAATKLGLGLLGVAPAGLLAGQILNQSGGVVSLLRKFWTDLQTNLRRISFARMRLAAWAYRGFPTYRLASQFILIFAQQAPVVFVAAFYGVAVAGQLAVAQMLVSLPVNLLSAALSKAAYGELASIGKNKPKQVRAILRSVTSRLLIISSAAALLIFLLAPVVLPIALGGAWRQAGVFASWLSVYLVATIVAVPMAAFVNIFHRQGEFLIWNMLRALLVVGLIACAVTLDVSALFFIASYGFMMLFFQAGVIARTNAIVESEVGAAQRRGEA